MGINQLDKLRLLASSVKKRAEVEMRNEEVSTRIIAVTSGKGGVGKTNLTLNLGLALAELGKKVLIMDADMGMANIDILYGISPPHNMYDVIKGEKELEEIVFKIPDQIDIISGASGVSELADLDDWEMEKILLRFSGLADKYDFLLIDTGAGISKNVLTFLLAADEVFLVSTPEPTSLTDAYGLVKTLKKNKFLGKINLVVNKVKNKNEGAVAAKNLIVVVNKFIENFEVEFFGAVSEDTSIRDAVKKQVPVVLLHPTTDVSNDIFAIAAKLAKQEYKEKRENSVAKYFSKLVAFMRKSDE